MIKRLLRWLPLFLFAGLFVTVSRGLFRPADRTVRSAMIGQPLPSFALPPLVPDKPGLASADFGRGQPRVLNVFASWCVPCVTEAPILLQLKQAGVPIEGVAVRDTSAAMQRFLASHGDAYDHIGSDVDSRVQLSLGSAGVPESFVVDGRGRIIVQYVGDIKAEDLPAIVAAVKGAR